MKKTIIINIEETNETSIMATEGDNIYYNPDYLKTISSDKRRKLFVHEILHIIIPKLEDMIK